MTAVHTKPTPIVTQHPAGLPHPQERHSASHEERLRVFRRRIIRLGVASLLFYPVLAGVSRLIHVIASRDGAAFPVDDPISDVGVYLSVAGLTAVVGLSFVYVGLRDWSNPLTRSRSKAAKTALVGVIATMLAFAVFAILINVANLMLH